MRESPLSRLIERLTLGRNSVSLEQKRVIRTSLDLVFEENNT